MGTVKLGVKRMVRGEFTTDINYIIFAHRRGATTRGPFAADEYRRRCGHGALRRCSLCGIMLVTVSCERDAHTRSFICISIPRQ